MYIMLLLPYNVLILSVEQKKVSVGEKRSIDHDHNAAGEMS